MKKTTKLDKLALNKLTIGQLTQLSREALQNVAGGVSAAACEPTQNRTCSCFNC